MKAKFCLLEQHLPNGPDHPFAKQMIRHFNNLHTPLKSIHSYPKIIDQERRFKAFGWHRAHARSLWDLWSDPSFLSAEQRRAINDREPFDEWEDFVLFASHYFLLEASSWSESNNTIVHRDESNSNPVPRYQNGHCAPKNDSSGSLDLKVYHTDNLSICRRHGAAFEISSGVVAHHGGLGAQGRVNSTDLYTINNTVHNAEGQPDKTICSRMCHTITNLANGVSLLVGGRTSPDHGLADCWLRRNETWQRVEDLPLPLYRHSATVVQIDSEEKAVLIFGGRTNSRDASNCWYLWHDTRGWIRVYVNGSTIAPRFGAMMSAVSSDAGVMFGGMAADGTILQDFYSWKVVQNGGIWSIELAERSFASCSSGIDTASLGRFGGSLVLSSIGLLLVGGVSVDSVRDGCACICFSNPLALLEKSPQSSIRSFAVPFDECGQQPLLVGHSVCGSEDSLAIVGGGSNCFSFGTYWSKSVWTLQSMGEHDQERWTLNEQLLERSDQSDQAPQLRTSEDQLKANNSVDTSKKGDIACLRVNSKRDFERIMHNSKPVKMEKLDLGSCLKEWSFDALRAKVGSTRPVMFPPLSTLLFDNCVPGGSP